MEENGKPVCVLYLCKRDNHCYNKCDERCHLTSMKEHAKNTFDKEPWNDSEHFKRDETPHKVYYTEVENDSSRDF